MDQYGSKYRPKNIFFLISAGISILSKKYFYIFFALFLYQTCFFHVENSYTPSQHAISAPDVELSPNFGETPTAISSRGGFAEIRRRRPHSHFLPWGFRRFAEIRRKPHAPHFTLVRTRSLGHTQCLGTGLNISHTCVFTLNI